MTAREKLIALEDVYDHQGSSALFMEAMRECVGHHVKNNDFFRALLEDANVSAVST